MRSHDKARHLLTCEVMCCMSLLLAKIGGSVGTVVKWGVQMGIPYLYSQAR